MSIFKSKALKIEVDIRKETSIFFIKKIQNNKIATKEGNNTKQGIFEE